MKIRQLITSTLFALIIGLMAPMGAALADTQSDIRIGNEALNDGEYETAFRLFNNALEFPDHPLSDEERGRFLIYRGLTYNLLEQPEKSLIDLGNAIPLKQGEPTAYYNYGQTLLFLEKWKEAIPYFDKALQLRENYLYALLDRAHAYSQTDDTISMLNDLNAVLFLEPENFDALYSLAIHFMNVRNLEEALKNIDLCIKSKPDADYLYIHRGAIYAAKDQPDKAYENFKRAFDLGNRSEELLERLKEETKG